MKKISILLFFSAIVFSALSLVSCGGDDETSGGGGENVISNAIGTWMCTQSTDTQQGYSAQGLMVGKEITINYDGTYVSTAPSFGYSGTYVASGNLITARSSAGTFVVSVSISGDRMVWDGTASNGVSFRYVFTREAKMGSEFNKDIISGENVGWKVSNLNILNGSSSSVQTEKILVFNEDGTCEAFTSMENAWRINNGNIETYCKETNEPIFVYKLLTQEDGKITVMISGTLDDNFQAIATMQKYLVETSTTSSVEESLFNNRNNILSLLNACYASCADFESNQLALERIRTNKSTTHNISSSTQEIRLTWSAAYKTINYINILTDNSERIGNVLTGQEKESILAEARALRAFVYYNIAMLWGDVILKTHQTSIDDDSNYAQVSQRMIYQFAYSEISEVLSKLPDASDRFNKQAGLALKAELELSLGFPAESAAMLKNLVGGTTSFDDVIFCFNVSGNSTDRINIYTSKYIELLIKEAENASNVEEGWANRGNAQYGYWAALKRYGIAQSVTGCYDSELLMPRSAF